MPNLLLCLGRGLPLLALASMLAFSSPAAARRSGLWAAKKAAGERMHDRLWAQTVVRHDADKRPDKLLSKGFAGSIKLCDGKVVKTVAPTLDSSFGWKVDRAEMTQLFKQEIEIQDAVSKLVPGFTPRIFESNAKTLTFSMELVPGKHLWELSRSDINRGAIGRFERNLARVHGAGIGHGDLKPANIMVVDGELKLIDWGAGRRKLTQGGKPTVIDHFLQRTMGYPGRVDLVRFDNQALPRLRAAIASLPDKRPAQTN